MSTRRPAAALPAPPAGAVRTAERRDADGEEPSRAEERRRDAYRVA